MSEQANVQRIGAYAWCLILTAAGGALIIGALGGAPGEEPAMVIAGPDAPAPVVAAESDGVLYSEGEGMGITPISTTE